MKTYRNLYPQVCTFENLFEAYRAARRGKRGKAPAADFIRAQEQELLALQDELCQQTYRPGPYHSFYIHEPKRRLISAAPFRDRVVHHALCQVIEPLWEQRFIHDSYANRAGKGAHRALDRCQQFARHYAYVLQCDIRQFFPSIDHAILRDQLAGVIAEERTLWLCDAILASGVGVLSEEYHMAWFPGDDLLAALRCRGLPIGNLTSQFWANVYLNAFDHFVKRQLKCPAYQRYVDDFLLFGECKQELHTWRDALIQQLAGLRLTIHENQAQVFPTYTGIPYLGFRVYPSHRLLKRRKLVNYRRRLRGMLRDYDGSPAARASLLASLNGWHNHVRYGNTWGLRKAMFGEVRL
ncbi:MAG: reverse transcriptase/maturase family protein [Chloroflexota bacterium]